MMKLARFFQLKAFVVSLQLFSFSALSKEAEVKIDLTTFDADQSEKLHKGLSKLPVVKFNREVVFGDASDTSKPHYWLDPYTAVFKAGPVEIFCHIPVTHHGAKVNLKKVLCILKTGTKEYEFKGLHAATIYKHLKLSEAYWVFDKLDDAAESARFNLGPFTIKTSKSKDGISNAALIANENYAPEEDAERSGIFGYHDVPNK